MSTLVAAYMVTSTILALRYETGAVTAEGRTLPYLAEAGDRTRADGLVTRNGKPLGFLTRTPGDQPMLQTFDRFAPSPAIDFFQGASSVVQPGAAAGLPGADAPASYKVELVVGQAAGPPLRPAAIWRKSKIVDTARSGPEGNNVVVQHEVFLELAEPLLPGLAYRIEVDHPAVPAARFTYDPATVASEAVHVSQIGFRPDDPLKTGFLSMWLGRNAADPEADGGVAYPPGIPFRLRETRSGEAVFHGMASLDEPRDEPSNMTLNYNRTDVLALDFSAFQRPGEYVIEVEGVGTSMPFAIAEDVWDEAFRTAMQGFYHQRSGIALDPALTDWPRPRSLHPADGFVVYQSGATLMDTDQGLDLLSLEGFAALVAERTDEVIAAAWGGWHDAGDWDRRIQHLHAVRDLLDLVELRPAFARAMALGIPERDNDLPDILDEALWTIDFYHRLQKPDGGVPGGIEAAAYPPKGETSWTSSQAFFVYAPDAWSSYLYAGVAARAAFLLKAYDSARARQYATSALAAMVWAEANTPAHAQGRAALINARNLAAAELYRLTGEERWHEVFRASSAYAFDRELAHDQHQFPATLVYARTERPVDAAILERATAELIGYADFLVSTGRRGGFGQLMNPWTPYGWSYTSALPVEADSLVFAHAITGDPRYFSALIGETQFGLGANPDNMAFTTGLGHRSPREVLLVDKSGMGGLPPGLTIFGGWNMADRGQHWSFERAAPYMIPAYPDAWPVHETHIGYFWAVPITEYTIHGTIARTAKAWGYIAASGPIGPRPVPNHH